MQILHTMLRVGDLDRSIKFYQDVLGMRLLRTSENPEYKYSLAFEYLHQKAVPGIPVRQ